VGKNQNYRKLKPALKNFIEADGKLSGGYFKERALIQFPVAQNKWGNSKTFSGEAQ
jgi:hypothetical protein